MQSGMIEEKSAFFFSAVNTLISYDTSREAVLVRALKEMGSAVTLPTAKIAFIIADASAPTAGYTTRPKEEREKFWAEYAAALVKNCSVEDRDGKVAKAVADRLRSPDIWIAYGDVEPALETLRKRGCLLGVIANGEGSLRAAFDKLSLSRYLDIIVLSEEVGFEKPDPRIFQTTMDKIGLAPERCAYVGDIPEIDLKGASRAGLTPVWLDRNRLARRIGEVQKIEVLTDLEFLFPIVPFKQP
ncbi:MAG: HAD-IA family hydrolase [Euryarchaeota archaeon]|nr:HAD-IA family hydrolase [Euryarchaeota archaeon]